eukprot:TRINITY_DN1766_c0_g1_i1.p1 TRINITY_DN1766_c0_g1~~TRINITY_DN1766_c0_g1_i1.p1  ORF type:complete len:802 (+),score=145.26 TRINITY_DN1766_c0_g1_i1:276-2681(+)
MRGVAEEMPMASADAGAKRYCFVEWEEQFVSHDKGSRVVHYFLKDQLGNAVLAVVGTERSLRHMIYVISEDFLQLPGVDVKPSFKWRSRREVVDWLTSLLSRGATEIWKHDSPRISDTDLSNGEDIDEQNKYHNSFKGKISRKGRDTSKGIIWLGSSWTCRKRLKHFESFHRSGITISVNDFVYVMAEENMHHIAYLEDMYEDKKYQKKVRVRWFHRRNEVTAEIPAPPADAAEIFITPFTQVLSVECVDGLAVILTPEHYDKCLGILSAEEMPQVHVCFRQFDNEGIKSFNLSEIQGYWQQEFLKRLNITNPHISSRPNFSDGMDVDGDDVDTKVSMKKGLRKTRCSRKRAGPSSGRHSKEMNKGKSGDTNDNKTSFIEGVCGRRLFFHTEENGGRTSALQVGLPTFDVGSDIEVLCQDSGIRGCWFRCTVIKTLPYRLKVKYKDLLNEDDSNNLEEWIPSFRIAAPDKFGMRMNGRPTIRPSPPPEDCSSSFEIGSFVDAWLNDGWWEGVVVMTKEPFGMQIFFPGENFYLTLQRSKLRHSKEWVQNQWLPMGKNIGLAASLVLYETSQAPDSVCLRSSGCSNDYLGYVASGELDNVDSSDRRKLSPGLVSTREPMLLVECTKEDPDSKIIASAENGKGQGTSKISALLSNFFLEDESHKLVGFTLPDNAVSLPEQKVLCKDMVNENMEVSSGPDNGISNDLQWKSPRKRKFSEESALLQRSGTACGKEESKRINSGDLETSAIEDESNISTGSERHQENLVEGKRKQGHESVNSMHGASISETLFISSVPVASLVMSR